jgi:hypothetical protein
MAYFIGRRYGDFHRLHKKLHTELPGKILPPLPKKNKQHSMASNLVSGVIGGDDDASSLSSVSTMGALGVEPTLKSLTVQGERIILCVEFYANRIKITENQDLDSPTARHRDRLWMR